MAISTIKAEFPCDAATIWSVVTSLTNYAWRSDLGRIEVKSDKQFVEYTKEGYPTTFTVTAVERPKRWEFDMDNTNMTGHWTGIFTSAKEGAVIEFTENVTAKKWLLRPFVKGYLKKQQKQYVDDLQKAIAKLR